MKKNIYLLLLCLLPFSHQTFSQNHKEKGPKLVVGIVIDQMRYEYLLRYRDNYGEGGFVRMMEEGFNNKNTHYNYIPTKTAPGHASIYTGTTPKFHGIIANSWYDRNLRRDIENVEDTVRGEFTPINLLSSTITDELKLSTQSKSKVISVSLKNRGAILPAGHNPDGAYWYDDKSGQFMSSSYYGERLPQWLVQFNNKGLADSLLNLNWEPIRPVADYHGGPDASPHEKLFKGKKNSTFPYPLSELRKHNGNFKLLPTTPFGNTILTQLAKASIQGENLGNNAHTDFLAISYSSPDKVGHDFGPQSIELEDVYIRLDKDLEELLAYLDQKVGKDEYLVFLTADHAVAETVGQMQESTRIPAGNITESEIEYNLNLFLSGHHGDKQWVEAIVNEQIYLDRRIILEERLEIDLVQQQAANFVGMMEGVAAAYPAHIFKWNQFNKGVENLLQMGYHPKRSGDVLLVYEPGWMVRDSKGTTHGSGYNYDTHVPLLWFGKGIKKGMSVKRQHITDIAPTLAFLLNIKLPNAAIGDPIEELFAGH